MSHEDADALVTLQVAGTEFEAQTIVAVLREREIEAVAFPSAMQTLGLEGVGARMLGGIPVQVRACDVERAKAALRANKFLADSVDWDMVDVGEEDPEARRLAAPGGLLSFGKFMVTCGKWAIVALVVVQAILLLLRCA